MPLTQGVKPCLVVPKHLHRKFRGDLIALGYRFHDRPKQSCQGEIQVWVGAPAYGDWVYVQEILRDDGHVEVFAHTAPREIALDFIRASLIAQTSYSVGFRFLESDLRRRGWDV